MTHSPVSAAEQAARSLSDSDLVILDEFSNELDAVPDGAWWEMCVGNITWLLLNQPDFAAGIKHRDLPDLPFEIMHAWLRARAVPEDEA